MKREKMRMLLGEEDKDEDDEGSSDEESDNDYNDDSGDEEEMPRGEEDFLQTRDMDIPKVSGIKVISSKS